MVTKTKPAAKAKPAAKPTAKPTKAMTPLEKARAARAAGGAPKAGAKRPARKPLPIFKAPADFKPFFLEVLVKTEKDGLLSNAIKATRYIGRYDPEAPDKKKFDLASYDLPTLQGVLSRLSMTTWATNVAKRLPANTTFKIILRVNRRSKDQSLSVLFKAISMAVKNEKTGRIQAKALDKKDPKYRMFRKASRILPAAFKGCLMPPKRVRGARVKSEDDGEE
jgi:hypothetical protein